MCEGDRQQMRGGIASGLEGGKLWRGGPQRVRRLVAFEGGIEMRQVILKMPRHDAHNIARSIVFRLFYSLPRNV